jgi:hypothetical protein
MYMQFKMDSDLNPRDCTYAKVMPWPMMPRHRVKGKTSAGPIMWKKDDLDV